MATAKLWWNGSAWKTTKTTCVSNYSGYSSSSYAYVWYKVWIAAYDNGTIKMSTDLSAYQGSVSGTAWISDGTKTMKAGGTTLGTGTFSNVDVTNYIGTNLSWSGNVYCKIYWQDTSGSIYVWKESAGSPNYASGTINMATSPFRTITYNANGGTGAPSAKTVVTGVSSSLSTTVPTRTGYTFLGWNTDSSATTATYSPGSTISTTSNITLYAIWKAQLTQIDAPNGTIGTALTITLTQQGSSYDYNHTIKWTINGTTATIASNVTSSSQTITQSWTPAIATIVPLYTDRSSYPCTLTCETYNGATLLGSMTKTITLAVPSSCAPTISGSVSPTNNPPSFTDYVSGKSKAQFTYTATASYSASIASWKYTINGATTTVADSATTKTYTPATAVTSSPVSVTVVDSRGMSSTAASTAVTVASYSAPAIANPVITRALQDGTIDEQGEYLLVTADIAITALNNLNTKNYAIKYKLHSDSTWTDAQASTALSGYTVSLSWLSSSDIISNTDSYDVQLIVTDYYSSTVVQQTVSTSATIIDILSDGTGVAFGTIANTSNAVQINPSWDLLAGSANMSGNLTVSYSGDPRIFVKNSLIDSSTTPALSAEKTAGIRFRDKNNREIGYVQASQNTAGRIALSIIARRYYNGANVNHGMYFRIAADGTRSFAVDDADSIKTGLGCITKKLLWTNSSPSSSYASATVPIDLSGYDQIEIIHRYGVSTARNASVTVDVGDSGLMLHAGNFNAASGYIMYRTFSSNTSGVTFNASYRRTLNSTSAASSSNDYCIPVKIYGIKGIT